MQGEFIVQGSAEPMNIRSGQNSPNNRIASQASINSSVDSGFVLNEMKSVDVEIYNPVE
jgi:hypothetical protein